MIKTNTPLERLNLQNVSWNQKRLIRQHIIRYNFCLDLIKNKTVFDIACGTGYGSYLIAISGAKKVIGIDNNPETILNAKKAHKRKNLKYILADAAHVPFKKNCADVVISFETIEHLQRPEDFISEVVRLLKPKGLLLLSTPNRKLSYQDNPYHVKEYDLNELNTILTIFNEKRFFGQRKVNIKIFGIYKFFYNIIKKIPLIGFIKIFFRYRPWESLTIVPFKKVKNTNYAYFIIECRK